MFATYSDVSVVWLVGPWVVVGVLAILWALAINAYRDSVHQLKYERAIHNKAKDSVLKAQAEAREEWAGHEEARRLLTNSQAEVYFYQTQAQELKAKYTPKRDKLGHFAPKKKVLKKVEKSRARK